MFRISLYINVFLLSFKTKPFFIFSFSNTYDCIWKDTSFVRNVYNYFKYLNNRFRRHNVFWHLIRGNFNSHELADTHSWYYSLENDSPLSRYMNSVAIAFTLTGRIDSLCLVQSFSSKNHNTNFAKLTLARFVSSESSWFFPEFKLLWNAVDEYNVTGKVTSISNEGGIRVQNRNRRI